MRECEDCGRLTRVEHMYWIVPPITKSRNGYYICAECWHRVAQVVGVP